MSGYQHYRGYCIVCGKELPKRSMNKIYISKSHHSVPTPKLICSVCDDCVPTIYDYLGVREVSE